MRMQNAVNRSKNFFVYTLLTQDHKATRKQATATASTLTSASSAFVLRA